MKFTVKHCPHEEARLSQRDRATLRVIEYLAISDSSSLTVVEMTVE